MSATPSRTQGLRGLPRNPRPVAQAAPSLSPAPAPAPAPAAAPHARRVREKRSMPSMDNSYRSTPQAHSERSRLQTLRQKKSFHSTTQRNHAHHHASSSISSSSSSDTASLRSSSSGISSSSASNNSTSRTSVASLSDSEGAEKNESARPFWHGQSYSVDGTSVWKSVTGVANLVSQEVNKVWATGITPLNAVSIGGSDEDESRHLLDTMRRYHLSKTANPMDLPEWLFSERERGVRGTPSAETSNTRQTDSGRGVAPRPLGRLPNNQSSTRANHQLPTGTGSASDRLRAKRSVHRMGAKV